MSKIRYAVAALLVLASSSALACDDGKDRTMTVANESRYIISHLYASNTRSERWGLDILVGTIRPGDSREIDMDDNTCTCMYDLRAVSHEGHSWEKRSVNVCSAETWTLYSTR